MTAYQHEFDQAVRFLEDQAHDLKTLLQTTPSEEFADMWETLSALHDAVVTAFAVYLAAIEIATEQGATECL